MREKLYIHVTISDVRASSYSLTFLTYVRVEYSENQFRYDSDWVRPGVEFVHEPLIPCVDGQL